jgi:CubicO group peptidase (beta-lactamase class C family)
MKKRNNPLYISEMYLKKLLEKGVKEGVFPGAAAGVFYVSEGYRKKVISYSGYAALQPELIKIKKENAFDLASLTKPLATTLAVLCLVNEKKVKLNDTLPFLLQKDVMGDKKTITLEQLLSHSSGLPAHREYFKKLKDIPSTQRKKQLDVLLLEEELGSHPGTRTVYSDLGFMLLGRIIETQSGCDLDQFVKEKVMKPIGLENRIIFRPIGGNKNSKKEPQAGKNFVATENCTWRGKVLCGEVHDDNSYVIGGISGHSGIFGDIESVLELTVLILDLLKGRRTHPNIKKTDLQRFLKRQNQATETTWALGFDTPSQPGSSSGRFLSRSSVGHLGFTGTSFWIDPEKELVVVLLSNRVHPNRSNEMIRKFRPFFHDAVVGKLFPPN